MVDEDTLKVAYDIVLNNAKSHKSFLRKTHWEIHIPKPKEVWLQIQIKYQRRKYKIPDCCLPMKNPDWYRYCMKALVNAMVSIVPMIVANVETFIMIMQVWTLCDWRLMERDY